MTKRSIPLLCCMTATSPLLHPPSCWRLAIRAPFIATGPTTVHLTIFQLHQLSFQKITAFSRHAMLFEVYGSMHARTEHAFCFTLSEQRRFVCCVRNDVLSKARWGETLCWVISRWIASNNADTKLCLEHRHRHTRTGGIEEINTTAAARKATAFSLIATSTSASVATDKYRYTSMIRWP